jgi:hypothetical protein
MVMMSGGTTRNHHHLDTIIILHRPNEGGGVDPTPPTRRHHPAAITVAVVVRTAVAAHPLPVDIAKDPKNHPRNHHYGIIKNPHPLERKTKKSISQHHPPLLKIKKLISNYYPSFPNAMKHSKNVRHVGLNVVRLVSPLALDTHPRIIHSVIQIYMKRLVG